MLKLSHLKHSALITLLTSTLVNPATSLASPQKARGYIAKDDGALNQTFAAFRTSMLEAIDRKDKAFIEQQLSEHISTAIGGTTGVEAFEKQWQELSDTSLFWDMAKKILTHGAQFDRESNEFHAPALSFDDNHSDFPQGITWSKDAQIFAHPDAPAPIARAPYNDQLTILEPKQRKPLTVKWIKVKTKTGTVGYMRASAVSSGFDDFAVFKLEDGKWKMSWFGYAEL